MKIKNVFYICLMCILLASFFSCDLTQDKEMITETTETEQTRSVYCPAISFSGHNASYSFVCNDHASVVAMCGGGTLTFRMSGGSRYYAFGKIKKMSNYGGGKFITPGGSITATSSWKDFGFTWTSGNCYLNGDGSCMGGGVYVDDLVFYKF
jgi:hypothetical protein